MWVLVYHVVVHTLAWFVCSVRWAGATVKNIHYGGGESNEEDFAAHGHPSQGKLIWTTKTDYYNKICRHLAVCICCWSASLTNCVMFIYEMNVYYVNYHSFNNIVVYKMV